MSRFTKKPCKPESDEQTRSKLIGLGEKSIRKSYYPELKARMKELERFKAALDQSTDMIFLVDPLNLMVIDLNKAAEQSFHRKNSSGSLVLSDVLPAISIDNLKKIIESVISNNKEKLFETKMEHFLKGQIFIEISVGSVISEARQLMLFTVRDISRQKQAENEHKKIERQLTQMGKMEAVGTLAGGISHDFNNILQSISVNNHVVLNKAGNNQAVLKAARQIEKNIDRAAELIRHILAFSRKMPFKAAPVELAGFLSETVNLLKRTLPKDIDFVLNLDGNNPVAMVDAGQLEMIIINMANNAKDAMPEGGIITFTTAIHKVKENESVLNLGIKPGSYALLTISDTGHGIAPEIKPHVFEPFFTTKEVGKGSGLGLATAYGIISRHDGIIGCYSDPGAGTAFKIYLPLVLDYHASQEAARGIEYKADFQLKGNVLLVDDEPMILDVLAEALAESGLTVFKATSGEDALLLLSENKKMDLVVLDLGMPGMGGEKCLAKIKKKYPDQKVIVASGYSDSPIARTPAVYGAQEFLPKPYSLDLLKKIISRMNFS